MSTISFGAWAIGSTWGPVSDDASMAALRRALDLGINFFDTADVYGDGHSERLIARLRRERKEPFFVATKAGRRVSPHVASGYSLAKLTCWIERSLKNLEVEALDLLQLHCPPTDVYYMPEVFEHLDELVRRGKVRFYGVSVERVEEALKAIEYPNVQTVQIIFNVFRQRPVERLFPEALRRNVGILARLPLSSGMLTGKLRPDSKFHADDHRAFNREGAAFDRGETFSGIEYQTGLAAVEALRGIIPPERRLTEFALGWILEHQAVTCAIPGGRSPEQVEQNARAAELPPLSAEVREAVERLYDSRIKPLVHQRW